jgi:hypothetical protein|tara:strand:- start:1 stop:774 length:774 start_codon:yes stop_codon:yes gene_type:complete
MGASGKGAGTRTDGGKNGSRGDGRKCKYLKVRCTDEDGCGWKGNRATTFIRKTNGGILQKPCPKCGKPVYRPEKNKMYQIAAKRRLRARIPEEDRVLVKLNGKNPTLLTQAHIARVTELIEQGNFPVTAAVASGIPAPYFGEWMKKGRRDWAKEEDTLFSRLYLGVEQSQAIAEANLVKMGIDKIEKNQSTWMGAYRHLESFKRDHWLKTQEVNINSTHTMKDSIDVPPEPPQSHEEWMTRREERQIREAEFEEVED